MTQLTMPLVRELATKINTQVSEELTRKSPFKVSPLMAGVVISLSLAVSACQDAKTVTTNDDKSAEAELILASTSTKPITTVNYAELAQKIAQQKIIIDTHIDAPARLANNFEDISESTDSGDFDFPRAVSGGLNASFMSIYIPPDLEQTGGSKAQADKLITMIEEVVKNSPDKFALAYSPSEIKDNFAKGLISLPMRMENGSPIEGDLGNLKYFYDKGIRYITLAHSKANHISDSSYDEDRPAGGLTDFGKALVVEMNNIGVMVDVSHISDEAFNDVMAISKVPVIASHSSARYFTPNFERNMSDVMIQELAKNGGVIQINFGSLFITQKAIEYDKTRRIAINTFIEKSNADGNLSDGSKIVEGSVEVDAFKVAYKAKNPYPFATLSDVLDHFDHIVNLTGMDHVGIGSDYDGVGDSLPEGLKDAASYPNLIEGLLKRGYSEVDIDKILSGNILRVWQAAEDYAEKH